MLLTTILFIFLFSLTNVSVSASNYQSLMVQKMNAERQRLGRSQIVLDSGLSNLAQIRSKEIAVSFSHQRPNNTAWHTVFQENGLSTGYAGENIAKKSFISEVSGAELADVFYHLWKNSPGHYQNMIKEEHRYLGLALYKEGNIYHMVQIFNSEPSSGNNASQNKPESPTPKKDVDPEEEVADSSLSKKEEPKKRTARVEILKDVEKKEKSNEDIKKNDGLNEEKKKLDKKLSDATKKFEKEKKQLQEKLDQNEQSIKDLKKKNDQLMKKNKDCEKKLNGMTMFLIISLILNVLCLILLIFLKIRPK